MKLKNIRKWIESILSAAIGGAASGITVTFVDPESFNFDTGLGKLGTVCLVNAIVAVATYLKQHPIPASNGD